MTIIYVDSNAAGSASGLNWTDAYTTLQVALTAWTTSDEIWIAHNSTESFGSSITLTCPLDTVLLPVPIFRVNSSTNVYAPPPFDLTDTAQIVTTSSSAQIRLDFNTKIYGVRFDSGGNFNTTGDLVSVFEDCDIEIGGEATSTTTLFPGGSFFKNCYFRQASTGSMRFSTGANGRVLKFIGCIFDFDGTLSTGLIVGGGSFPANIQFIDCDLSALPSATILVDTSVFSSGASFNDHNVVFTNCKLPPSYVIGDGTMNAPRANVKMVGCSANGSTNYINRHLSYVGETDTSTAIYLIDGYVEFDGDVNLSLELAPTSKCTPIASVFTSNISSIIETTGSKTFTLELVENFTTALTEQELWLELFYYDSASNTHHKLDTSTHQFKQISYTALSAGTGLVSWTNEPSGSRSVKLEVTVTVNKIGHYYGVVHVGKYEAGKVVHVDPELKAA